MLQARQQQWENILQITVKLHQLSVDKNWQSITELESERFVKIEKFFSTPVSEADVEEVEKGIRQMLESDELLKKNSISHQQDIAGGVKKISTGRQAIKAYGRFEK